ncbi:MAG TPA: hypothetical protein VE820_07555, partial [Sphingomicrobium sp.]|nr:hypothetical protein [Sphingomicrobium sp.]
VLASRCSSLAQWIECPSVEGRGRRTVADRRAGRAGVLQAAATALTSLAAGPADLRGRASRPRASRGWVEVGGVSG